jgi:tetratricopeptide (TPR) repeat protein
MAKLIDKIVNRILPSVLNWFYDRYFPQHVRQGLPGDKRPLAQRLWSYNKGRIFGIDGLALLSLCAFLLYYLQLQAIYRLVFAGDPSFEFLFPSIFFAWFQYALQIPIFAILLIVLVFFFVAIRQRTLSRRAAIFSAVLLLVLVIANASYGPIEGWMIAQKGALRVFELAEDQYAQAKEAEQSSQVELAKKHYAITERLFRRIGKGQHLLNRDAEIWAYLSHIDYQEQRFETSFEEACKSLLVNSDVPQTEIAIESLRGSIYDLAHTGDTEYAEAFLERIAVRYGEPCVSEASPYWLAISPDLMNAFEIDIFQKHAAWWKYFPVRIERDIPSERYVEYVEERERQIRLNRQRYEQDMAYLERLVETFPDKNYVDYALFFLGRYLDIIVSHRNSPLLDEAYYAWGLQAFGGQSYKEAVRRYRSFLDRFENHDWRDDALWRIAKAHFVLGDYPQALRYLTLSKNEPYADSYVHEVDLYCDIAYVMDVGMNEEEIQHYARLNTDPEVDLILKFTLALKYLGSEEYDKAQALYEKLVEPYPGLEVSAYLTEEEDLGLTLARLSAEKIKMINKIEEILEASPPDSLYDLAEFYSFNPSIFENRLLGYLSCVNIVEGGFPPDYFMTRNAPYRAAELLRTLVESYPDLERLEAVIRIMAESYDTAASDRTLTDPAAIEQMRVGAVAGYRWLLARLPEDSTEFDEVFEAVGAVYLHRPNFYEPGLWYYTEADIRGLQREYTRLAKEYPNHHLTNNALNWVAWSYCYLANLYVFAPDVEDPDWAEYEENYRQALAVYRQLSKMDPLSGITQNAIKAAAIIEEKLANPNERTPVSEERWRW